MLKLRQPPATKVLILAQALQQSTYTFVVFFIELFIQHEYQLSDKATIHIGASFGALTIVGYLLGGLLSDRVYGYRTPLTIGCLCLFAGFFCLTDHHLNYLYWGLAAIVIGHSLFVPCLSGFLSDFFYERDTRRRTAFIWLYLGMNAGALIAATLTTLALHFSNWISLLYLYSITPLFIALILLANQEKYENRGHAPIKRLRDHSFLSLITFLGLAAVMTAAVYYLLLNTTINSYISYFLSLGVIIALSCASLKKNQSEEERFRIIRFVFLVVFSIIFWGVCYQEFLTLPLFINRTASLQYVDFLIHPLSLMIIIPLLVIIFCSVLASVWKRLRLKRHEPSPGIKVAFSLLSLGIGMTLLTIGSLHPLDNQHVSAIWILFACIFFALGKALLFPTGLALTSVLAPKRWRGLLLALWFMTVGMGILMAERLAKLAAIPDHSTSLTSQETLYASAFAHYAVIAYTASAILFLLVPILRSILPIHLQGTTEH